MQTNLNKPKLVTIWSQPNCTACTSAKTLLTQLEIPYNELMVGTNGITKEDFFKAVPNARSVPQIFADGEYIGGFMELKKAVIGDYTKAIKI
jgi:glutaredoxin